MYSHMDAKVCCRSEEDNNIGPSINARSAEGVSTTIPNDQDPMVMFEILSQAARSGSSKLVEVKLLETISSVQDRDSEMVKFSRPLASDDSLVVTLQRNGAILFYEVRFK